MRKVCGVGINDMKGKWCCKTPSKAVGYTEFLQARVYKLWGGMLERCYSSKSLSKRPSYQGCCVCDKWLIFSNFIKDLPSIPNYLLWLNNPNSKVTLDKDSLYLGNQIYEPGKVQFLSLQDSISEVHQRVDLVSHLQYSQSISKRVQSQSRRVIGVNVNNSLDILEFSSAVEAERQTKGNHNFKAACISMVCRGVGNRKQHKGYYWRYM